MSETVEVFIQTAYAKTGLIFIVLIAMAVGQSAFAWETGSLTATWTDPARSRSIGVTVYYPADTAGSGVPVADGQFPVLVFGHGYLIGTGSYLFLSENIATQGYIIALPSTEGSLVPNHLEFGKDLAFLSDYFQILNAEPSSPFFGHVASGSAIMGHSMGGGASFLAIGYSASVTALVNFAAAETNPSAIAAAGAITLPTLMFSGTKDCVTPPADHQTPMYDALSSQCKTHLTIVGASHCQFAQNNSICRLGEFGEACNPAITQTEQETICLQYLSMWLDFVLNGNSSAWAEFQNLLSSGSASGSITFTQDCVFPDPTPTPDCFNNGDANLDNTLTASDAQLIFHFVLGIEIPSYQQACAADCNGNGEITAGDAQQTFNAVLGSDECSDVILEGDQ